MHKCKPGLPGSCTHIVRPTPVCLCSPALFPFLHPYCAVIDGAVCFRGNVVRSDIISLAGVDTIPGTPHMLVAELLSTQGRLDVCVRTGSRSDLHRTTRACFLPVPPPL
jgi:hypothetical protein